MYLGINEIKDSIRNIKQLMIENKDEMIEADSIIGDGDLGITMSSAFIAADEFLQKEEDESDMGKLFMKIGMEIAKASPSTMGTLIATGFLKGGKALLGNNNIGAKDFFIFFKNFTEGIKERGKAKLGEKTILDVLYPIVTTLENNVEKSLETAVNSAHIEAQNALDKTKNLISQHGKAAVFREKTLGLRDPGCIAILYIIQGFKEALVK